jgi:hypothetical protein
MQACGYDWTGGGNTNGGGRRGGDDRLPARIPAPGQYTCRGAGDVLGGAFLAGDWEGGFQSTPPCRPVGNPALLALRGPFGCGFSLPEKVHRLALVAAGESLARLVLASIALAQGQRDTVQRPAAGGAARRPGSVPPGSLPEALTWADFLAMDLPDRRPG